MSNAMSLSKSIQTCKIDTGEANRLLSDRFLNPNNMMCPAWDGTNLKGQAVCADSFWTKRAGCNSAVDRLVVENDLRPDYISYVTLSAAGIAGNIYGNPSQHANELGREKMLASRNQITGNFGLQFGADRRFTGCTVDAYNTAMAQEAQAVRGANYMQNGYNAAAYKAYAGSY